MRNSLKSVARLIDSAKESLPVEQDFLNQLKRSIELQDMAGRKLPSRTYKPSGMNCVRQSYYQLVGKEPDEGGSSYIMVGICNSGTDIHVRVQSAVADMVKNNIPCEYIDVAEFVKSRNLKNIQIVSKNGMETKLYHTGFNMSFMCDGIIKFKNHYYILEIKTEASGKWLSREGVDKSHYNQATAYSIALGLDEIIFVYVDRNVLDMKAYLFKPTAEMKQDLVGYIEECDRYVKQLIVPPKPKDVAKKTCEYCSYRISCRKEN